MMRVEEHHPQAFPVPAIDAHNRIGRRPDGSWVVPDVSAFLAMMDEVNLEGVVNYDSTWGDDLEANLDRYDRAHPGRFASFCNLPWSETATAGWGTRLAASMRDSLARGAVGVSIWKDVGLRIEDETGALFFLDDPRLEPVWAATAEAGVPALLYMGDPPAFWRPLDGTNERYEELVAHPDWHFHDPRFPPLQRLLDSLEACIAANPAVTFLGAHVGSYAEDLGWVDRILTTYPNFYIDIADRMNELGRKPRAARRLIEKHSSRVMLGTDNATRASEYRRYLRFLATDDECFAYSELNPPPTGRWLISGLDLSPDVLAAVVSGNARRLIPAFGKAAR
jgi:predicted TIM-barrel fold metal-dependent hydrolase